MKFGFSISKLILFFFIRFSNSRSMNYYLLVFWSFGELGNDGISSKLCCLFLFRNAGVSSTSNCKTSSSYICYSLLYFAALAFCFTDSIYNWTWGSRGCFFSDFSEDWIIPRLDDRRSCSSCLRFCSIFNCILLL